MRNAGAIFTGSTAQIQRLSDYGSVGPSLLGLRGQAQLLTYLRLGGWKIGLLINFNVPLLRDGIVRRVHGLVD